MIMEESHNINEFILPMRKKMGRPSNPNKPVKIILYDDNGVPIKPKNGRPRKVIKDGEVNEKRVLTDEEQEIKAERNRASYKKYIDNDRGAMVIKIHSIVSAIKKYDDTFLCPTIRGKTTQELFNEIKNLGTILIDFKNENLNIKFIETLRDTEKYNVINSI
jgi:hypothetical protein